jgi:hypothetical protein
VFMLEIKFLFLCMHYFYFIIDIFIFQFICFKGLHNNYIMVWVWDLRAYDDVVSVFLCVLACGVVKLSQYDVWLLVYCYSTFAMTRNCLRSMVQPQSNTHFILHRAVKSLVFTTFKVHNTQQCNSFIHIGTQSAMWLCVMKTRSNVLCYSTHIYTIFCKYNSQVCFQQGIGHKCRNK